MNAFNIIPDWQKKIFDDQKRARMKLRNQRAKETKFCYDPSKSPELRGGFTRDMAEAEDIAARVRDQEAREAGATASEAGEETAAAEEDSNAED